jgi:pyruvate dehydrogenase E2 component (dihydrolipoamide acetyltransferase)
LRFRDGEDDSELDGWTPPAAGVATCETEPEPAHAPAAQDVAGSKEPHQNGRHRLYASPIARRIAAKARIDLETIAGSGPQGRVVLGDVEAAAARQGVDLRAPAVAATPASAVPQPDGGFTIEPADNVRKIIAERLTEAKRDIPHFYLSIDVRIDRLLDARVQLNELANPNEKVSVNDFFVKACAYAMREVPGVNASWTGDGIAHFNDVNIAVAVASPKGLMTPVLRKVDSKSLATISSEIKDLAARARLGKLKPDEFKGGGFTVSNLGMYGIREFSAIINPPQACILAIGAGEQRPIVRDNKIIVGTMASCTLSVDHRAVDGSLGAEFLQALKKYVERPAKLLS